MEQSEKSFVDTAFKKCAERKWLKKLIPSEITDQDITEFEEKYRMKLPPAYRAFLTSYQLPGKMFEICGIASHFDEISPLWLILYGITGMKDLSEHLEFFREDAGERQVSLDKCSNLIPIGDWGAGWGPLCIDVSKEEELADEEDESTWSLVWFDHEEFDWDSYYVKEDGQLHGTPAAPNLKTLLDWYFCGSLETEFEEENQVKVNYERLNDMEFCSSYWDDKWKEKALEG